MARFARWEFDRGSWRVAAWAPNMARFARWEFDRGSWRVAAWAPNMARFARWEFDRGSWRVAAWAPNIPAGGETSRGAIYAANGHSASRDIHRDELAMRKDPDGP